MRKDGSLFCSWFLKVWKCLFLGEPYCYSALIYLKIKYDVEHTKNNPNFNFHRVWIKHNWVYVACKIKTFSNLRAENVCSPVEAKCRSVLAGRSEMSFCVCRIKSFVEAREVNESLKSLQSYTKSVENHLNNNTQRPHNRASSICINLGNFDSVYIFT